MYLSWSIQVTAMEYHQLRGGRLINNENLSLTVLKAVKSKVKSPIALVSAEISLPGSEGSPPSLFVLVWWEGHRSSLLLPAPEVEKIQTRSSIDKKTWHLHSVTIPLLCRAWGSSETKFRSTMALKPLGPLLLLSSGLQLACRGRSPAWALLLTPLSAIYWLAPARERKGWSSITLKNCGKQSASLSKILFSRKKGFFQWEYVFWGHNVCRKFCWTGILLTKIITCIHISLI